MRFDRKYLVAVALLAVLAVVFGLAGTVMPASNEVSPKQSSSDSVAHFQNPPTFDSDWVNITDKCGQYFNITHDLNSVNVTVDITGKTTSDGRVHQRYLGGTGFIYGWSKTYGETSIENAFSVIQASDGGYAIAGFTYPRPFGAGGDDAWLVKTDQTGNIQWNKTYGGADDDYALSVVQTSDGGYALAGYTYSFGVEGTDFWLIKTDSAGNMQWNQTYGGTNWELAYSMVQTIDGGYALAGEKYAGMNDYDLLLVKANSSGNMEWSRTYGETWDEDHGRSVVQTSDGGYALAGYIAFEPINDYDLLLVKVNSSGDMQWKYAYATDWMIGRSVVQTSDGGYAIAGLYAPYGEADCDFLLFKVDSSGTFQWRKTYGGTDNDMAHSVVQTSDGGYAIAGTTFSWGAGDLDFWLVKTDQTGNVQWSKAYGGVFYDEGNVLVQTSDGGYAIAGYTESFGTGESDFWLVKTDVESGLAWTDFTNDTITLYRGATDPYWNYVRVRIWVIEEPTWQFGDINQDGVVDAQDLYILGKNYGKTFSLLSLTGIAIIAGFHTYKKRKEPK